MKLDVIQVHATFYPPFTLFTGASHLSHTISAAPTTPRQMNKIMQRSGITALRARPTPQLHANVHKQSLVKWYSDKTSPRVPPRGPVLTQNIQRPDLVGAGIERPQIEGKTSGIAPQLLVLLAGLMATPPIIYYYWQYRDQHMREKKEAMLKEIQARAARTA